MRRRGERVAAQTQLEVDRQIVQNMYRRRSHRRRKLSVVGGGGG